MGSPIFLIDEDNGVQTKTQGANGHKQSNGFDESVFKLDLAAYSADFNQRIVNAYNAGDDDSLIADISVARSLIPAGTGVYRDFSYIAPEIPEFNHANCVGCMTCVTECPDTAILGKVVEAIGARIGVGRDRRRSASLVGPTVGDDQQIPHRARKERGGHWRLLWHLY